MYMSQHRFTPVPEKLDQWVAYNRNYMALTAAAPGAVLSRILRIEDDPKSYFAIGLWADKDAAIQWTDSPQSKRGAQPSQDLGLYEGYPMTWSRWELVQFACGPDGRSALPRTGGHVRHVVRDAPAGDLAAPSQIDKAALSMLVAMPGFVSGETYFNQRHNRILSVLTFKDRDADPFEADAIPEGLRILLDGTPASVRLEVTNCTQFECVWGPEAARLDTLDRAAA